MRKDNVMLLYDYFYVKSLIRKVSSAKQMIANPPTPPLPICQLLATPLSFVEFCQINLKFTLIQSVPRAIILVNTF